MTEKQYEQYRVIKKEIDNLKSFLFACGVKYRKTTGRFPTKFIRRGEKVKMYDGCGCCEYDISPTLQKRIIATIEQYVDEKHEELNQI